MEICIDMTAFFWEMLSSGFLRLMRSWVIDEARVILSFVSPCLNCKQAELSVRLHRAKDWKASLSVKTLSLFFFFAKSTSPKVWEPKRGLCLRQRDGTGDWGERIDSGIYRCFISVYRQWENKWNCSGGEQILSKGLMKHASSQETTDNRS